MSSAAWSGEEALGERSPHVGLIEEVVTTATKRTDAESAQDVPIAMGVLGSEALANRHVTDLMDLSLALPNVSLDKVSTSKGIANFTIRGQGVNGSVPSMDPTVGLFVDGMYLGLNYGVLLDMLDLESVEVLRGPQGLLFGRNVTGGAVLLRSRRPSGGRSAEGAARLETGPEWRVSASAETPLVESVLDVRLSGSYRNDAGWFTNDAPGPAGGPVGSEETWVARPVAVWTPTDALEVTLIHERGRTDADSTPAQNRKAFEGFNLAIDEPGLTEVEWRHWIVEANRHVAGGRGRITNVFGWRHLDHASVTDIDATAEPSFHILITANQSQISNELRYSHAFDGGWDVTLGAYHFSQELEYREQRLLRGEWGTPFGGDQDHSTSGAFLTTTIDVGSAWTLTAGVRYTYEEKDVGVAASGQDGCFAKPDPCRFDFNDKASWTNVTPKIGVQRWIGDAGHVYAHYTKGFRSGGYNLRNTAPGVLPGPFDEEDQDSFEAGFKFVLADGGVRLNMAAFHNEIHDLQRQVGRSDETAGAVQITANAADATIKGIEADITAAIGGILTLNAFIGLTDGQYENVLFDLDGDGSTEGDDKLAIPRLAKLSWGAEAMLSIPVGWTGRMSARIGFAHRDRRAGIDDNSGWMNAMDMLDASLSYAPGNAVELSLFGRNLLGRPFRLSDFPIIPAVADSTHAALREGRVVGMEVRALL